MRIEKTDAAGIYSLKVRNKDLSLGSFATLPPSSNSEREIGRSAMRSRGDLTGVHRLRYAFRSWSARGLRL